MIVIVCGSRTVGRSETTPVSRHLDRFHFARPIEFLIQGGADGVDRCALLWAQRNGIPVATVPANWAFHKQAAGPIRNSAMLKLKPDAVLAFPGGSGTADIVKKAKAAGVEVVQMGEQL